MLAVCALGLAPVALAQDPDPIEESVREIREALRDDNYIAVTNALDRAEQLRAKHDDEAFEPVLRAIAGGVKHSDPTIALATVLTLGRLRISGSGHYLHPLLSVPSRIQPTEFKLYLGAIEAAGTIGDADTVPRLLKLLNHDEADIAVAAAKSLQNYKSLEVKDRLDLIKRLGITLGRFEKMKPRKMQDRMRVAVVKNAIVACVRELTGNAELGTAAEVRDWHREALKASRES